MTSAILTAWRAEQGDVLAFLPGVGEINRVQERLAERLPAALVLPLHGQVQPARPARCHPPRCAGAATNRARHVHCRNLDHAGRCKRGGRRRPIAPGAVRRGGGRDPPRYHPRQPGERGTAGRARGAAGAGRGLSPVGAGRPRRARGVRPAGNAYQRPCPATARAGAMGGGRCRQPAVARCAARACAECRARALAGAGCTRCGRADHRNGPPDRRPADGPVAGGHAAVRGGARRGADRGKAGAAAAGARAGRAGRGSARPAAAVGWGPFRPGRGVAQAGRRLGEAGQ
jgi:hypothetical protein